MKTKLKLFIPSFIAVIILDQLTKWWAWVYFHPNGADGALTPGSEYLWGFFRLTYAENSGAFLGMGSTLPSFVSTAIFMYLIPIGVIAGSIYVIRSKEFTGKSVAILGAVFAGGFSNVLDRYYNDAHVIDFLNVGMGGLRTGIFNVADMFVMFGAFFLIGVTLLDGLKKPSSDDLSDIE